MFLKELMMLIPIASLIRRAEAVPFEDIKKKFRPSPEIKPPRRNPSVQNKTDSPAYMRTYMKERREDGEDYQKVPSMIKELRKKQKQKLKEKGLK